MKHTITLTAGELCKVLADHVVDRLGLPTQLYSIFCMVNMKDGQIVNCEVSIEDPTSSERETFTH